MRRLAYGFLVLVVSGLSLFGTQNPAASFEAPPTAELRTVPERWIANGNGHGGGGG